MFSSSVSDIVHPAQLFIQSLPIFSNLALLGKFYEVSVATVKLASNIFLNTEDQL